MNPGILILLGFLAFTIVGKGVAAKNLRCLLAGASFKRRGGLVPDIVLAFDVQNATGSALTVRSIVGDVVVNGSNVGNASSFDAQRIAPYSASRLSVTFRPSVLGMAGFLVNAAATKMQLTVQFVGTLNAEGLVIPINQTQKLL